MHTVLIISQHRQQPGKTKKFGENSEDCERYRLKTVYQTCFVTGNQESKSFTGRTIHRGH